MESSMALSYDSLCTTSSSVASSECGGDSVVVGSELEAAEALAGLAHSALPTHRVKTESPPPQMQSGTTSPPQDAAALLPSSCPSQEDQAGVVKEHGAVICTLKMEGMDLEQDAEFHKPSHISNSSYVSCSGSKSRQQLTEAEKEARRVRRVLANRESARQTIRRRQALYEELTRKAAGLASENENLKKEKEVALEEYDSLKSTNDCLKAQMAKKIKAGVEETRVDSKPANVKIPTSSNANCPYLIFSQPPFSPFPWPSIIPSSNPVQLNSLSQNAIFVPSEVPMPSIAKPDICHEPEIQMKVNCQGTPLYIVPYPWFFPVPDHGDGLNPGPSLDLNDEQTGNSNDNRCTASSSSKIVVHEEKNPVKAKPEAPSGKYDSGAAEAAEARRKRKELIKLKRLHCR